MTYLDGLARKLDAGNVATYNPDGTPYAAGVTGVYLDGVPAVDGDAVVLTVYPGPEPDSRNGWRFPRLQVRVRAADAVAAQALDQDAYDVLQAIGPVTLADPEGTFLQDCYALQSAPQPLGQDANGRHEYTRNYQLTVS